MNNAAVGNNSTAIGMGQTIDGSPSGIVAIGQGLGVASISTDAIAIGKGVEVNGLNAIAIGNNESDEDEGKTYARGESAIAIGHNAQANSATSIAIGKHAEADLDCIAVGQDSGASGSYSIALGRNTFATGARSVAIGGCHNTNHNKAAGASGASSVAIGISSRASHEKSVAIGYEAETTTSNQIVLGSSDATVYIPGNLVVGGNAYIGTRITPTKFKDSDSGESTSLFLKISNGYIKAVREEPPKNYSNGLTFGSNINNNDVTLDKAYTSDRRLKNVGEKYTAGLAELKKLDFFHYTFKKDEAKTPHVGVMAQDLDKVFPDAVTKDEDGYLRIRFEDMFYAVINAVKELDNKITEIVENITGMQKTVDVQQEIIEELQKQNKEILKQNEELQKRIEKLEKNK